MSLPRIDHSGKTFGRLTVVKLLGKVHGSPLWLCLCSCGNSRKIPSYNLVHSVRPVRSCGCYRREFLAKCSRARPCVKKAAKRRARAARAGKR